MKLHPHEPTKFYNQQTLAPMNKNDSTAQLGTLFVHVPPNNCTQCFFDYALLHISIIIKGWTPPPPKRGTWAQPMDYIHVHTFTCTY